MSYNNYDIQRIHWKWLTNENPCKLVLYTVWYKSGISAKVQQQFEDILERITIYQEHNLRGEYERVLSGGGGAGGFSYHITLNPGVTVPTIGSTQKKRDKEKTISGT